MEDEELSMETEAFVKRIADLSRKDAMPEGAKARLLKALQNRETTEEKAVPTDGESAAQE